MRTIRFCGYWGYDVTICLGPCLMLLSVLFHVPSRGCGPSGSGTWGEGSGPAPHENTMTDTCKNITFPQLRLRAVINVCMIRGLL